MDDRSEIFSRFARAWLAAAALVYGATVLIGMAGYILLYTSPGYFAYKATAWQERWRGLVRIPVHIEAEFKLLRANQVLKSVDTLVIGSSTIATLGSGELGKAVYNAASSGNLLKYSIGHASYLANQHQNLKYIIFGYDWIISYAFLEGNPSIEPEFRIKPENMSIDLLTRAVRFGGRFSTLSSIFLRVKNGIEKDGISSVPQQILFGGSVQCRTRDAAFFGHPYQDGCYGYDLDGSSRLSRYTPLSLNEAGDIISGPKEKFYANSLHHSSGKPNDNFLGALAAIASTLRSRGGRLIVLLPPVLPGLESQLGSNEADSDLLTRFKKTLTNWSTSTGVLLIDAGRSEALGCLISEFIDGHHALPSCYQKVVSSHKLHLMVE